MDGPDCSTETLLVAGTASHVGKSTVAAGLCRHLARQGVDVAPFKAQNMSNNARVVLDPDGGWGEIGVSQYVQARAAGIVPTTDVNPVLLKPRGEGESQLIVQGSAVDHLTGGEYFDEYWSSARAAARESYRRLADEHEVIVAEGAGSIAEINLHDRDLANVETARFTDGSIVLVGDIERGGVFASLYGTLELMPTPLRDRVVGAIVTKFRGDRSILEPALEEFETRTDVPILGVLPYDDPGLPAEDSVSLRERERPFGPDGVDDVGSGLVDEEVTVAVVRLPHISNFTDLEPLSARPDVSVRYVPIDGTVSGADAVVVPGTKNTVDDLLALREAGLDDELLGFDGPIVGLCGGYQLLGERITNASIEGTGDRAVLEGLGVLPVETRFSPDKTVRRVVRTVEGVGPIAGASGRVSGYEIHMGHSEPTAAVDRPLGPESAATERYLGTYLHGLFENATVRRAFLDRVFEEAGTERAREEFTGRDFSPYDRAADLLAEHVDLERLPL